MQGLSRLELRRPEPARPEPVTGADRAEPPRKVTEMEFGGSTATRADRVHPPVRVGAAPQPARPAGLLPDPPRSGVLTTKNVSCGSINLSIRTTVVPRSDFKHLGRGSEMNRTKVMVDTSVFSRGTNAHYVSEELPGYENRLLLVKARPEIAIESHWLRNQFEALPTIAELAETKVIELFTYHELWIEIANGACWPGPHKGIEMSFFENCKISWCEPALPKDAIYSSDPFDTEVLRGFCERLKIPEAKSDLKRANHFTSALTERQLKALDQLERFSELAKGFSKKQLPDAFHVWTTEVNCLDCFLTLDKKLINIWRNKQRNKRRFSSPVSVLSPTDFLKALGREAERKPRLEAGKRYLISGNEY